MDVTFDCGKITVEWDFRFCAGLLLWLQADDPKRGVSGRDFAQKLGLLEACCAALEYMVPIVSEYAAYLSHKYRRGDMTREWVILAKSPVSSQVNGAEPLSAGDLTCLLRCLRASVSDLDWKLTQLDARKVRLLRHASLVETMVAYSVKKRKRADADASAEADAAAEAEAVAALSNRLSRPCSNP